MQLHLFNYRFADEILQSERLRPIRIELLDILRRAPLLHRDRPKKSRRRDYKGPEFTTDQLAINAWYDVEFKSKLWEYHPEVTGDGKTQLKADFKKDRVQVEIQFGNMARWYTDIFKMQVSYSLDKIDVGVLAAPVQSFAKTIDENVVNFERVRRELPYAKMSITLPILVVGLQPENGGMSVGELGI